MTNLKLPEENTLFAAEFEQVGGLLPFNRTNLIMPLKIVDGVIWRDLGRDKVRWSSSLTFNPSQIVLWKPIHI